jgi:hypothetical protein
MKKLLEEWQECTDEFEYWDKGGFEHGRGILDLRHLPTGELVRLLVEDIHSTSRGHNEDSFKLEVTDRDLGVYKIFKKVVVPVWVPALGDEVEIVFNARSHFDISPCVGERAHVVALKDATSGHGEVVLFNPAWTLGHSGVSLTNMKGSPVPGFPKSHQFAYVEDLLLVPKKGR